MELGVSEGRRPALQDTRPDVAKQVETLATPNEYACGKQDPTEQVVEKERYHVTTPSSTSHVLFAIGERLATAKMTLGKYGMEFTRTCQMQHFTRKDISPDARAMLQAIERERPRLLWIQWNDTSAEPHRRPRFRTALEFITGMVELQLQLGGDVIMEARACDAPVRDELMSGD